MRNSKKISINDFDLIDYIESMQPLHNYTKFNYWYVLRHIKKVFNMTPKEIKRIYVFDKMQRLKNA